MIKKSIISQQRRRQLKPPFAWIDRRFMFDGYFAKLSSNEILLYLFLVLVADKDGLSYYSYEKICQLLHIYLDAYVQARDSLIHKQLIAFDGTVFQVLALPEPQKQSLSPKSKPQQNNTDFQAIATIFSQLTQPGDRPSSGSSFERER